MTALLLAPPREYVCPGEGYSISRAVHLGRQAAAYPKCRECPLRDEGAPRREDSASPSRRLFKTDGVRGIYRNELDRSTAERLAAALAAIVWEDALAAGSGPPARGFPVVVAHDDRPWSLPLAVAAASALRRSGCETIDVGLATGPAFRFAVAHLDAAAGVFATGAGGGPAVAGLDFALAAGRPLSLRAGLDRLADIAERGHHRPTRKSGGRREFDVSLPYEAGLRRHFRSLTTLAGVVGTASPVLLARIERLAGDIPSKLRLLPLSRRPLDETGVEPTALAHLGEAVREARADFGLWIDESGDTCRAIDETGRIVPVPALAGLLLSDALDERPGSALALDWPLAERLAGKTLLGEIVKGNGTAEAMFATLRDHSPSAGADSAGRLWLPGPPPSSDALVALARLVRALAASGKPLSRCSR